jgi:hypothetical protein
MAYGVRYTAEAEADLARISSIDPVAASTILDEIDRLAADPVSLSRKPGFPHRPFQKYQFNAGGLIVTILFQYSADEQDIEIQAIGVVADNP